MWARIVGALADGGYDYVVSIEHEDELLDTTAAVTHSVEVLKPILARFNTPVLGTAAGRISVDVEQRKPYFPEEERMSRRIVMAAMGIAALLAVTATASGGNAKSSGVIQLTCMRCEASPSDVFSQSWYDVVQQFNAKYKTQYHINVQHFGGQNENDLQYWERLALAGSLPDIFIAQSTQLQTLAQTGKLFNFAPGAREGQGLEQGLLSRRVRVAYRLEGADLGDPRRAGRCRHLLEQGSVRQGRLAQLPEDVGSSSSPTAPN